RQNHHHQVTSANFATMKGPRQRPLLYMRNLVIGMCLWLFAASALALDAATVNKLGFGEGDEKIEAIAALVAEGDPAAVALLQAAQDGELQTSGKLVLIVKGDSAVNAATGA